MSPLSMGTAGGPLCPEQIMYYNPMRAEGRAYVPEMRKQLQGRQTLAAANFLQRV